jgi:hypothetical protein
MGIGSWFVILLLGSISLSFTYFMFKTSHRILLLQERLQQTGEQRPEIPLITLGILGVFGIVITFAKYAPSGIINPRVQTFLYYFGILLYISVFISMFFVGRSYARPGFPQNPMSITNTMIGLFAAILPFVLLMTLGVTIVNGGMTRTERETGTITDMLLIIVLLLLPSVSGIFGAGVFGKLSVQN